MRARAGRTRLPYRDLIDGHIEIAKPFRIGYTQTATHALFKRVDKFRPIRGPADCEQAFFVGNWSEEVRTCERTVP